MPSWTAKDRAGEVLGVYPDAGAAAADICGRIWIVGDIRVYDDDGRAWRIVESRTRPGEHVLELKFYDDDGIYTGALRAPHS